MFPFLASYRQYLYSNYLARHTNIKCFCKHFFKLKRMNHEYCPFGTECIGLWKKYTQISLNVTHWTSPKFQVIATFTSCWGKPYWLYKISFIKWIESQGLKQIFAFFSIWFAHWDTEALLHEQCFRLHGEIANIWVQLNFAMVILFFVMCISSLVNQKITC